MVQRKRRARRRDARSGATKKRTHLRSCAYSMRIGEASGYVLPTGGGKDVYRGHHHGAGDARGPPCARARAPRRAD